MKNMTGKFKHILIQEFTSSKIVLIDTINSQVINILPNRSYYYKIHKSIKIHEINPKFQTLRFVSCVILNTSSIENNSSHFSIDNKCHEMTLQSFLFYYFDYLVIDNKINKDIRYAK